MLEYYPLIFLLTIKINYFRLYSLLNTQIRSFCKYIHSFFAMMPQVFSRTAELDLLFETKIYFLIFCTNRMAT